MLGLHDDYGPPGIQLPIQGVGDLSGQPLLKLRTTSIPLDHPGQLGEAHDLTVQKVTDVGLADEGQ